MVSFAGNLTYRSAGELRAVAAEVPLARLLVETDAPYLAPVPKRGKRNVPAWVRYTALELAAVRGLDPAELEEVLDENAERLFGFEAARARRHLLRRQRRELRSDHRHVRAVPDGQRRRLRPGVRPP